MSETRDQDLTREHRAVAVDRLIKEAPQLLSALVGAQLLPSNALSLSGDELTNLLETRSVNDVERALFQDPFVCSACASTGVDDSSSNSNSKKDLPPQVRTRVCPVDNKPHRRLLIEVANRFIGLVAEARASVVVVSSDQRDPTPAIPTPATPISSPASPAPDKFPASASAAAAASGNDSSSPVVASPAVPAGRPKVKRPMPKKPHLLVLAFHAASHNEAIAHAASKSDAELKALASAVCSTMVQIWKCAEEHKKEEAADKKEQVVRKLQRLLAVFDRTWRNYVIMTLAGMVAAKEKEQQSGEEGEKKGEQQQEQQQDDATKLAPVSTPEKQQQEENRRARTPPADRAEHSGPGVVGKNKNKDRDDEHSDGGGSGGASISPDPQQFAGVRPVAPPFSVGGKTVVGSSGGGRGGSVSTDEESDSDTRNQQQQQRSMLHPFMQQQQQLSPEQQQQMAMNILLEQKRRGDEAAAREAYASRVRMRQQNAFEQNSGHIQKVLNAVSEEVESKVFLEELQQRPPKLDRIPFLLRRHAESLVAVIPSARLRAQLERELQDVLDWDLLRRANTEGVSRVMQFVVGKVIELGAPAREQGLREELDALVERLKSMAEDPSAVIVDAFRFLRSAIKLLGEDIHKAQLAMVRPELAKRATQLQRQYLDAWTQPPPSWLPSTKAWIDKWILSSAATSEAEQQQQQQQQRPDWDKLKVRVLDGVVDLLRSSGRPTDKPRWSDFPSELLYFEKPVIFTSANQVQMLVVRMMIVGTARSILKNYINTCSFTPQQLLVFEAKLDRMVVELLTGEKRMSISELKDTIEAELQFFVVSNSKSKNKDEGAAAAASSAAHDEHEVKLLESTHVVQLRGVMDQMIQTNSSVYTVFEKRVLATIISLSRKELEKRSRSRGGDMSEDTAHRSENAEELKALGQHVVADVSNVVLDLADLVEHNVAVYAPRYEFIHVHKTAFLADPGPAAQHAQPPAVAAAMAAFNAKKHEEEPEIPMD